MTSTAYQKKKDWVMNEDAMDRLLVLFDSEPDMARHKYDKIRAKLTKLFQWRGCPAPEEYATKTIEGAAKELLEGTESQVQNPYLYFHGVAIDVANVLKEHWGTPERDRVSPVDRPADSVPTDQAGTPEVEFQKLERERRLQCLKDCVSALEPESLDLITRYHRPGEGKDARKELARSLGIPQNTLRIRALRIRSSLESSVTKCLSGSK
jgi:hypothetical protein